MYILALHCKIHFLRAEAATAFSAS